MVFTRTSYVLFAAACLVGCAANHADRATNSPTSLSPSTEGFRPGVEASIRRMMKERGAASVSLALVDDGKVVWLKSFGWADRAAKVRASPDTFYEVGSVSKPFVSLAVMRLAEAGQVNLDAPVSDYVKEFTIQTTHEDAPEVTLRALLSHHSGVPADLPGIVHRPDYDIEQLPAALRDEWMLQPPGKLLSYSNVGIDLAGLAVSRVVGRPFPTHVEHDVLELLGMERSSFVRDASIDANLAVGYDPEGAPAERIGFKPCGSLRSTAREMAHLVQFMLGEGSVGGTPVVSGATFREMTAAQYADLPLDLGAPAALGWFIQRGTERSGDVLWHGGSTDGFRAQVSIVPTHGIGVVVLANDSTNIAYDVAAELLAEAVRAKSGVDLPAELARGRASAEAPTRSLAVAGESEVVGRTYSDGMQLLQFERRRRGLRARLPGGARLLLDRREDGAYDARVRVKGLPVKGPFAGVSFTFQRLGEEDVIVGRGEWGSFVFARRFDPAPVPDAWRRRSGHYELIEADEDLVADVHIFVADGVLQVEATTPGGPLHAILSPHSDDLAFVAGLGRRAGAAVRAVERDGQTLLYSQGFEFRRVEPPSAVSRRR